MNLSQIQSECGRLLNDPSNTRWTPDVLTTRINFAQTQIVGFTQALKTTVAYTPTANVSDVLIGAVLSVYKAYKTKSDGSVVALQSIAVEQLDFMYPQWRQWNPGEPQYWIWNAGSLTVTLAPAPDINNVATGGLRLAEIVIPPDLVNPTDIPFGAEPSLIPYHMTIVHWVVAQCWMDDGIPEALAKAKFHKSGDMTHPGQYELQLARMISEFEVVDAQQNRILFQPQGGRIGQWFIPNKTNPFDF